MRGVSLLLIVGLTAGWGVAQFLNNRPFPTYSLESMPDTDFTCRDKILGGYYADSQTQCQMFHICVKVAGVGVQDFRFLCPNATAFDQDHQICAEWDDVDCDATTLYYASDNFDLYRLGSGFESKAVKYGEDEETFSLQRAETGDARLNREHQAQRVNQQKDISRGFKNNNNNNNNNNDRDIFKTSSSSNFFNNRNGGKEVDDDDSDPNTNYNQNRDSAQKRKLNRRPVQQRPQEQQNQQPQQNYANQQNHQRPQQQPRPQQNDQQNFQKQPQQQNRPQQNDQQNFQKQPQQQARPQQFRSQQQQSNTQQTQNPDNQTSRPSRPTGFINNFAGSYAPTTSRTTVNNGNQDQVTDVPRLRNIQRRPNPNRQYNDAENFRSSQPQTQSTSYTVSTPAPFRQTQQYNKPTQFNNNNGQYNPSTQPPKPSSQQTENYPANFNQQKFQAAQQKPAPFKSQQQSTAPQQKTKATENYPTTPVAQQNTGFNSHYDVPKVKPTPKQGPSQKQTENYPTTYSPKSKSFSNPNQAPTTFAPKTNFGFTQGAQTNKQTTQQFNNQNTQQFNNQNTQQFDNQNSQNSQRTQQFNNNQTPAGHSRPFENQFNNARQTTQFSQPPSQQNSTPKSTVFTQYTPTVPKVTPTTPVSRSNRFDETQYDDGSYNPKYDKFDNDGNPAFKEDEFLKTAHSQNIASSRNEYVKNAKKATVATTQKTFYSESPRPFSTNTNTNTQRVTDYPKTTKQQNAPKPVEKKPEPPKQAPPKQEKKSEKNASYDYAYYDAAAGSEADYDIDTEFKKTRQ